MATAKSTSRRSIRDRRKRRQQKKKMPAILMAAGGIILLGLAWYFIAKPGSTQSSLEYSAEDVVYDQPLHAVHEMEPSTVNQIAFLPKDGPQPKISTSEQFFNFGDIGPTDVVTHDFVIANNGDAPLTIHRAYTTCGCTTADFTATVIPPGKVSIVTMTLDAGFHDVRGQTVRRGIIIENNDPKTPQMELWAQAAVRYKP